MNGPADAVVVSGLTIAFGDFKAVDGISFSVAKGEIFGFLGANGAGKTTTIRALCGLIVPNSGKMLVAGVSPEDGPRAVKSKVGYMSQRFTLYNDLTVAENLEFAAALRKIEPARFKKRVKELFDFIDFEYPVGTLVKSLPGGVKQQIALVASIIHDPEIIFLDEPTAGVSPSSRLLFWSLIRKLSGSGKTVFVTTHYMDEAEQCGRLALMQAGRIIALGSPAELKARCFAEPLYEIEAGAGSPPDWAERLARAGVGTVTSSGMRTHLAVEDEPGWEGLRLKLGLAARRIAPSLEDVFVKLLTEPK